MDSAAALQNSLLPFLTFSTGVYQCGEDVILSPNFFVLESGSAFD